MTAPSALETNGRPAGARRGGNPRTRPDQVVVGQVLGRYRAAVWRTRPSHHAPTARVGLDMGRVTAPDARFALGLHRLLAADRDRSFAWSPYSVASALGVVGAGARGATRDELDPRCSATWTELGPALAAGAAFPADAAVTLGVANTLWADLTLPVADDDPGRGQGLAGRRGPRRRLPRQPGRSPGKEINADVERSTRGQIQRPHPGRDGRPGHQGGRRQCALPAGGVGEAVREGGDPAAARPDPGRPGGRADDAGHPLAACAARGGWTLVSVPAGAGVVADVLLPDGDRLPELTPAR